MMAPIVEVPVVGGARPTHRERLHRGVVAVVWQRRGDREPWPAVGAVDERVPIPPIGRVEELGQAVGAGCGIGRHRADGLPGELVGAVGDHEVALVVAGGDPDAIDGVDGGQRRRLVSQQAPELVEVLWPPLGFDTDPVRFVADQAGQAQPLPEAMDEWPEPDPLDQPGHQEPAALVAGHGGHGVTSLTTRSISSGRARVTASDRSGPRHSSAGSTPKTTSSLGSRSRAEPRSMATSRPARCEL